jgi:hypothetical protein
MAIHLGLRGLKNEDKHLTPTGIQYVVFNAFTNAGIFIQNIWDAENAELYAWILSPTSDIVKTLDTGEVEPIN